MLEFLEKKLCASGQDAFFSLFPTLHQILDDFVRKQTNQQLALVFTFRTLVQRSDCEDGQTAAMFVQHLCAEYADKFNIDDQAIRCAASEVADPDDDLLTDIKEEPEDSPPMTERHDASPPPGKRKQELDGEAGDTSARKRRKAANQKQSRHEDNADVSLPRPGDTEEVDYGTTKVKVKPPKKSRAKGSAVKNKRKKEASARLLSTDAQITDPQDEILTQTISDGGSGEDSLSVLAEFLDSCLNKPVTSDTNENQSARRPQGAGTLQQSEVDRRKNDFSRNVQEPHEAKAREARYVCTFGSCDFVSKFKCSLKRHVMRVHDTSSVKCRCGMVFTSQASRDAHARRAHSAVEKCALCGQTFELKTQLRHHHVQHHTSQRRFSCSLCHKKFNNKVTYEGHLDAHSGVKRHKCSTCPRAFTYRSSLTKHVPLCKPKEKPSSYACKICGREFKRRSHVTTHMNGMHRSGNELRCVCGQGFSWSGSLSNHRKRCRIHNDQLVASSRDPPTLILPGTSSCG